jgi:hypothetical protein
MAKRPAAMPFSVTEAEAHFESAGGHVWNKFKTSSQTQPSTSQAGNPNDNMLEAIGENTSDLDRGVSDDELDGDIASNSEVSWYARSPGDSPSQNYDQGGRTLTANDWAFLKYRTYLGGSLSNF